MIDQDTLNTLLLYAVTACGAVTAALWLGMIIWTWRDMRLRSRDPLAQIAAVGLFFSLDNAVPMA